MFIGEVILDSADVEEQNKEDYPPKPVVSSQSFKMHTTKLTLEILFRKQVFI